MGVESDYLFSHAKVSEMKPVFVNTRKLPLREYNYLRECYNIGCSEGNEQATEQILEFETFMDSCCSGIKLWGYLDHELQRIWKVVLKKLQVRTHTLKD